MPIRSAALADLKRSTSDQYVDLNNQIAAQNKPSVDNGRLQITSADGRFSAAVRGLFQYDTAYYSQSHAASLLPAAYGPDLGSAAPISAASISACQARCSATGATTSIAISAAAAAPKRPCHIQSVYLQYDGLAPWAFRVGAFPPPANIEDGTSAGDTIFLERNAPSDLAAQHRRRRRPRCLHVPLCRAHDFRRALLYRQQGAGRRQGAGAPAARSPPNFDEQQAVVGRLSWLPIADPGCEMAGRRQRHLCLQAAGPDCQRHRGQRLPTRRAQPRFTPSPCPIRRN